MTDWGFYEKLYIAYQKERERERETWTIRFYLDITSDKFMAMLCLDFNCAAIAVVN